YNPINQLLEQNHLDVLYMFFFFFSSRRRHTRSKRDWSSDVCSSDLILNVELTVDALLTLSEIVINIDGEWTPVDELNEVSPHSASYGETRVFAASLDLTELAPLIQSKAQPAESEPTTPTAPQRASLFVRAASAGDVPSMAREAEHAGHDNDGEDDPSFVEDGVGATFILPVGKASQTLLPELHNVIVENSYIAPYSNRH